VRDAGNVSALPDSSIEIDDDASGVSHGRFSYRQKDKDMPRYFGPYRHHKGWRILVRKEGRQSVLGFATEKEAKRELRKLREQAERQAGITVENAILEYQKIQEANGLKPVSVQTTGFRLRKLFKPVLTVPLPTLTPAKARDLFSMLTGAVDSRRNSLAEAKTFCRKAKERGWLDSDLFAEVKGEGKRKFGKVKLSLDEAKKFMTVCLQFADGASDKKRVAGIGSAMALLFGLRASEITNLKTRDLDANGTIIRITRAKSRAGIRSLQVPEWFQPYLQIMAKGKAAGDPLIGHDRGWVYRNVTAICKLAEVTVAPPHGLRAVHGDLALMASATPQAVSTALGHDSQGVTFRHYVDQGIALGQDHERAAAALAPTSN
jgi:integrase